MTMASNTQRRIGNKNLRLTLNLSIGLLWYLSLERLINSIPKLQQIVKEWHLKDFTQVVGNGE
jgi:hypothetical protein